MSRPSSDDFELTTEDVRTIDAIISRLDPPPTKKLTIDYPLKKWRQLVDEVAGTYKFTIWDFTNDLSHRDFLERVLKASPPSLERKLGKAVKELDRKFYDSTFEVDHPTSGSTEMFTKEAFPWRYRVPIRHLKGEFDV